MKRFFSLILALSMLCMTFASCASNDEDNVGEIIAEQTVIEDNGLGDDSSDYLMDDLETKDLEREKITYTVMSMNVLGKYSGDTAQDSTTKARMKIIGDYVSDLKPDSIGIQEYGARNIAFLPGYLPSNYASVDFGQSWISTFYNTDKYTIKAKNCIRLTTSSNQKYCFTWVVFANKNDESLAYIHGNLHLEYKDTTTRITNAQEVNTEISKIFANAEYKALPFVITGDYNAKHEIEPAVFSKIAGIYNIKCAAQVAMSAEKGQATYHNVGVSAGTGYALDHVLVNTDTTQALSHDIIKENDYAQIVSASDHYPVVVKFSSKK